MEDPASRKWQFHVCTLFGRGGKWTSADFHCRISLPDQEEHYLCPGYDFADPADACAPVVEKYTDDMHFWNIKSPDW